MIRVIRSGLVLVTAVTIGLAAGSTAWAGKTPFDGKVVTSDKRFPTSASSKRAYFAKLRKQARTTFQENKEKKQWKIYFAAFFKRPLNDLEVTIKLYDVSGKKPHLKIAFESYLSERGQSELISYLKLDREQFDVNRHILMVVENRGRKLAQGKFTIRGEAVKYKGVVDFSAEEAQGQ